jgi:chlorophyll synthase
MIAPQLVVATLMLAWDRPFHAAGIAALIAIQLALMPKLLANPRERAPWYGATGVTLYVLGMLVAAFALRAFATGAP